LKISRPLAGEKGAAQAKLLGGTKPLLGGPPPVTGALRADSSCTAHALKSRVRRSIDSIPGGPGTCADRQALVAALWR
jgi:hypothetical protein